MDGLQKEGDASKHVALYREIANAAEKAKDPDLECAFLEKVLKISPSNNDARFRLAYAYSDSKLNQLAAYHYALVVAHTDWTGASNNLGVVYGELGYKAHQYQSFKSVTERYALAKANVASLFEVAGFLAEAEKIAKDVLSITETDADAKLAINRAQYVLSEIESMAKTEKDAIDQIAEDTKKEREFMCVYAESYCAPQLDNGRGIFTTVHGDMEIVREGASLKGEGTITKSVQHGGFNALLSAVPSISETTTYFLSLSAQLHGQSGIFELAITPRDKLQNLLAYSTRTIKGLLYFEDSGNTIKFLERHEKTRRVASAQRKH